MSMLCSFVTFPSPVSSLIIRDLSTRSSAGDSTRCTLWAHRLLDFLHDSLPPSGEVYAALSLLRKSGGISHSFAWQSTRLEPWAKAYYEHKCAEEKSRSIAVRTLSNIWARIIFAMLTSHTPFVSATFETAKQLHAFKAAWERLILRGKTVCLFAFN